ncbi:hypothetical protein ACFOW6_04805 [Fodinicurvata halophila]|uniref:Uncharacterized protein n=1 Tax=Fodinicurvata halophila TaxID=1419723 RepID=A0ABV8UJQ3_9PROT
MFKTYLPIIGFALTTTLAMPALAHLAQPTPSNEGYAGGYVAHHGTTFQTAETSPSFDTLEDGYASRQAGNPSLEGYSGNAEINQAAVLSTQKRRERVASNQDDFVAMERRVRYSGR